jgi:hypothetical protein
LPRSLSTAVKAARQLGTLSLYNYALYQLGVSSGYYHWKSSHPKPGRSGSIHPILELPDRQALLETLGDSAVVLIQQADEVVQGRVRLFGSQPVPLQLIPPGKLVHWTAYEKGEKSFGVEDVKTIWEPSRFGWAFTLGRAYLLSGNEYYAKVFWEHCETFLDANPPYLGPNWFSGQEAALRLFAFVFSWQVFTASTYSNTVRKGRLRDAIATHAERIRITLVYAKAQNNNHLLTEAAGLYTAGLALPHHPDSQRWRKLGWRLFHQALQEQITYEGVYIQHSTNYHRLMLQSLLWMISLYRAAGSTLPLPEKSLVRGIEATRWLLEIIDPSTGRVPNLGPNDGAYILPFSTCPFNDFRPVLQAAAYTFLGYRLFPPGPVDEMTLWLGKELPQQNVPETRSVHPPPIPKQPHILRNDALGSWAYFRAARFTSRPGHADQLHLDLWWRGANIALDPGTYLYNAQPPWDNSLARTEVHNTITIDGKDQMWRAGRFLWLDWAQARILEFQRGEDGSLHSLTAQHDGYQGAGLLHRRKVSRQNSGWQVQDDLLPSGNPPAGDSIFQIRLHWLLPDLPWQIIGKENEAPSTIQYILGIKSIYGWIRLGVQIEVYNSNLASERLSRLQLVRAGELVHGEGEFSPTWGWFSPTYNEKFPALSFSVILNSHLPVRLTTEWILPAFSEEAAL